MQRQRAHITKVIAVGTTVLALLALFVLAACGCSIPDDFSTPSSSKSEGTSGATQQGGSDANGETVSGAAFNPPGSVRGVSFNNGAAVQGPGCAIDVSHVSQGYAAATGVSGARLKLQVKNGDNSYNYDMPTDGTPIFVPMNMGNGTYTLRIMQNTSGSNYAELLSATAGVGLDSPFEPYLRPNVFCSFDDGSAAVRKAREITAGCATQGDALRAICNFIIDNVSYDTAKAERLSSSSGYVPNPDATLSSMSGICFDYASLGAAMLRSVGIPTRIVTGYVSPNDFYHAWIMVYIDGTWHTAQFSVNPGEWSRVDLTFASTGGGAYVGDGVGYQDRYVY